MAFVVEDGTGLTTSNAFVSVAAFKTYCDDRGLSYSAYTDPNIEQAIVRATDYLSDGFTWQGFKLKERGQTGGAQALSWPRINVFDEAGYGVDSDIVPQEVQYATIELALVEAATPGSFAPSYVPHERVKMEKVGPLAVEYDVTSRGAQGARPVLLKAIELISEFLESGGQKSQLSGPTRRG